MKKVKIAHIITDLEIGGSEMMLLRGLRAFKGYRYEHFVVSLISGGGLLKMIENENVRVYQLNLKKRNFIISFIRLLSILKKEKPQIVHNYLFHADIFGRIASRIGGIPIVVSSLRNENIGGRCREKLLRMTDFCVTKVIAVSHNVAAIHVLKGTTRKDTISLIYNGLELTNSCQKEPFRLRRDMNISEDIFLLSTVASLEPKKGHVFLFESLRVLKDKGYKFKMLVVGDGKEKARLKAKFTAMGLENELVLTGERKDIQDILVASDAFVLPSLWEGMPNALLEAMAAGLPVVATRVGGIPEAVDNNETGLLVDAKDSAALAEAIERLIKDKELCLRLGRNARERVKKNFDIKNTVKEMSSLYEELLQKNGKD